MLGILSLQLLNICPFPIATSSRQAYPLLYSTDPFSHYIMQSLLISSPLLSNFYHHTAGRQAETELLNSRYKMKFGKRLKQQMQETLPEWRDKFLSYKELKKLVKLISSAPPGLSGSSTHGKAEAEFLHLLIGEIEKFNAFFVGEEEDFIIRHEGLQKRIKRVIDTYGPEGSQPSEEVYKEEMCKIRKDIVNFHGEMVLLISYSNINYTGLAKILKKYDKRTGCLLRLPFIQKVLQQPFFTTDLVSKMVKDCEITIDALFPVGEQKLAREGKEPISVTGEGILRNTVAALLNMQEMRRGSSTYSPFSLPPLNLPDSDLTQFLQISSPIPIP